MNLYKSPISRAVAATFLIPCLSQAEIEIEVYGAANASIESLNNKSTNKKITEVSNNHSVFGVKGAVDAGSGVKGVFLYDAFVGLDNSAGGGGGDARVALGPGAQPRQPARDRVANYDSRGAGWRRLQR